MRTASRLLRVRLLRPFLVGLVVVGVVMPGTAAQAAPSISDIEQQIAKESSSLEKIVEQYNKVNEQLKSSRAQAAAYAARLAPLQDQLDAASAEVGKLAANAYKGADLAGISAVLAAGSPEVMFERISALNHVASYQQDQINRYAQAKQLKDAEVAKLDAVIVKQTKQRADLDAKRTKIKKELSRLYALRKQAYGAAQATAGASATFDATAVSGKAGTAVKYAYNALGKPYEWGADGPGSYDCSGLTMSAWAAAGVSLPHNAEMQWNALPHVSRGSLAAGDLVFYSSLGHVAIYIGGGKVIHAPTFGEVVKIASVDMMTPYGYARPS